MACKVYACILMLSGSCRMRICPSTFRRPSAFQRLRHDCAQHRCPGSHGPGIHGAVGALDHHQCPQRGHVDHSISPWRGSCRSYGDYVGVLPSQFCQWFESLAENQPQILTISLKLEQLYHLMGLKFLFLENIYLFCTDL